MVLAIFDLDNTLLNGDSDHAWGEFICDKAYVDARQYRQRNDDFYEDYTRGALDIYAYQRFALEPLKGRTASELQRWHDEFMAERISSMVLPKAQALINKHRQAGDYLLIITATNRFITGPIARLLGVDHLIATEPEMKDGVYTGEVEGMPCYQHGKIERLNHWLQSRTDNLTGSFFYSDSHNDLPLLTIVDHPVAVDPDEQLQEYALEHGWPIISLR
ncbi:MAG: HAD family hydrolase [Pseudomonadales bacterium]|nr:HAD family hydrolase [Pseudomonadales bacterium]